MLINPVRILTLLIKFIFGINLCYEKNIYTQPGLFICGNFAAQGQSEKVVADKIVAIVGDRIILYSDIKNAISDAIRNGNRFPKC